jgi:sugar phosphate isomerase/epimerase
LNLGLELGGPTRDVASELGVRGVPVDGGELRNNGVKATLDALAAKNLVPCQVGAFGFNALNVGETEKANLEATLPLAVEAGCPYVVINPASYHPNVFTMVDPRSWTEEALDEMARALESPLKVAEKCGAKISIEAINKACIHSPERFLKLKAKVGSDALRCNIDPTSLYGYWELIDSKAFITHLCTSLAGHYGIVHIKETALKDGYHIHSEMVPVGEGYTDWALFLGLVSQHIPADSWVLIEHCATPDEARNSVKLIKEAAQKAGVTLT